MSDIERPPRAEVPKPVHREFPDPAAVDGFTTGFMTVSHVKDSCPERYRFAIWSQFREHCFRVSPRQDIDLMLASMNLPPSAHLLRDYQVIQEDDLDQHLNYPDPETYGFIIELSREEFVGFYRLVTSSTFVQMTLDTLPLVWEWRDLPTDLDVDYNFMLYHYPAHRYDIGAPVTQTELVEIFRQTYPNCRSDIRLRVLVDSNPGDFGNMFLVENLNTEDDDDDGHLRIGRTVQLSPAEYVIAGDLGAEMYGYIHCAYDGKDGDERSGADEALVTNTTIDYARLFGDPDQELYLDDLLGQDGQN